MRKFVFFVLFFACGLLYSQESLKSAEEEYYDFLALQGLTERPYLNYRTLSDSAWSVSGDPGHPWQEQNLGTKRPLFGSVLMRVYGPSLFMSANTAAPYGQNDGALWQGKGFNASFTGGVRFEGYGVEATFKPRISFSQNAAFDIMQPSSAYAGYTDKAAKYGYYGVPSIDAPQRFGDKPFFIYDWGDSEIRYTWKTLTIGFGTQAVWLGPAYFNPILHSNNAPAYPKFDIGVRKQPVTIPWIDWYAGDVEFRLWVGYLSESDYFDNNTSNDHNMFHGLSFSYAPSFIPGLTLSANRVCLIPWKWKNLKYIFPSDENTDEDQKMSLAASWVFPQVGFEVFGEIGVDDFVYGGILGLIRHPFHTTVYTFGLKKTIFSLPVKKIFGEMVFEFNWMEATQTFYNKNKLISYSFYRHHQILQGYTNSGQWLGNAVSPAGNSQILNFLLYYPKGFSKIIIGRNNPDTNYVVFNGGHDNNYWANFNLGGETTYYIMPSLSLTGGLLYNLIIDEHYKKDSNGHDIFKHNFSLQFSIKWTM